MMDWRSALTGYTEHTDPRSPRYPDMPEEALHSLLMGARRVIGRVVVLAEVRELGALDAESARSWRELKTAALSLGQAVNAVSCALPAPPAETLGERVKLAWSVLLGRYPPRQSP